MAAAPAAVVLGRGRMGAALRRWLRNIEIPVRVVAGREVEGFRAPWTTHAPGILFLAVPDDALAPMAVRLAAWGPWRGWRVIHSSGALPARILEPLHRAGASVAAMHPMMTIAAHARVQPRGVTFSLEGDRTAVAQAAQLVKAWQGQILRLSPQQKLTYHLAATLTGPGMVVAMAAAERVLREAGLRPQEAQQARAGLLRLMAATLHNLETMGTEGAMTGPWARGDRGTIRAHRRQIIDKQVLRLYDALLGASPGARSGRRI